MGTVKLDSMSLNDPFEANRSISWSKNGFIAYSLPNTQYKENLFLTYLENIDGTNWQLANCQRITVKPSIESNVAPKLSIVEWSNLHTDLAVTDVFGNFYIYLSGVGLVSEENARNTPPSDSGSPSYELTAYNHLEVIYRDIITNQVNQRPNPAAQFTAFSWLPLEKPQIINKEAKLVCLPDADASKPFAYGYGVFQHNPKNLGHPIPTKQACIGLRRNGELILYYQSEHKVEYYKLSLKLNEDFDYGLDIQKADFGFPGAKNIILTTYDALSDTIRTYSITIDWGFLVEAANKQKLDPHYNTPKHLQKTPVLNATIIHEMSPNIENEFDSIHYDDELENILGNVDDNMEVEEDVKPNIKNEVAGEPISYKPKQKIGVLKDIRLVSPFTSDEDTIDVLLFYEYLDENLKFSTTIQRYKIEDSEEFVSPAFAEIGTKKGVEESSSKAGKEYKLVFQEQLVVVSRIISYLILLCTIILICEDGSIAHLHRLPTKLINWKDKTGKEKQIPETLQSAADIGFVFPDLKISSKNPVLTALSPGFNCIAYCELNDPSSTLTLSFAEKRLDTGVSAEELYVTSVAFAFHHAFTCYTNACSDDLLILMQLEVQRVAAQIRKVVTEPEKQTEAIESFIESIICESHKAINFQLDIFSKESIDKLISNLPLQKLLSLQLSLGSMKGRASHISANIAWIILNLRSACFGIMFLLSSIYRQISKKKPTEDTLEDSISRAEAIISLTGNVRWIIELIICLNQEMIQIFMYRNHSEDSKVFFKNSIVLPIILSKVPRLLLMHALSSIGKTHEVLKRLNKDLLEANKLFTPMKDALNRYFTACTHSPLNLNLYENFIRECDTYIKTETGNLASTKPKGFTLKMEQRLVCHGKICDELMPLAKWVVGKQATFISRDLKIAEMFYYNVDWLDIGFKSQVESIEFKQEDHTISNDVTYFKKEMIPRQVFNKRERIDVLRKILFDVKNMKNVRKCVRCRSMSLINDPLVFSTSSLSLWTVVFQRTCICGSAWVNLEL